MTPVTKQQRASLVGLLRGWTTGFDWVTNTRGELVIARDKRRWTITPDGTIKPWSVLPVRGEIA